MNNKNEIIELCANIQALAKDKDLDNMDEIWYIAAEIAEIVEDE